MELKWAREAERHPRIAREVNLTFSEVDAVERLIREKMALPDVVGLSDDNEIPDSLWNEGDERPPAIREGDSIEEPDRSGLSLITIDILKNKPG